MADPLADYTDVEAVWRPLTEAEISQVAGLIDRASAKLRQAGRALNIDLRVALFGTNPDDPYSLDPLIVADVVATIVKRFMVNPDGYASTSEGDGDYSISGTFVNRYDKTGSDVRGAIQVIQSDLDQLFPGPTAGVVGSIFPKQGLAAVVAPGWGRGGPRDVGLADQVGWYR